MKRLKKIWILLGVLVVCCIAAVLITRVEAHKEQIRTTGETILSISPDDVQSLSWNYEDTSLSFHKEDSVWYWDDDSAFPADADKIHDLLSVFEDFTAAFIIDDPEDLSQYGLDEPVCTISLTTADASTQIDLGTFSTLDSERYVSIGDGKAYLVPVDPFDSYEVEISDLIKNDTTPDYEQVTSIAFTGAENYTVTYEPDSTASVCADDVYFTDMNSTACPLDTSLVESYCKAIKNLSLENYSSYNVTTSELSDWGLDEPELTVTLTYTGEDSSDEQTFTLNIGRDQALLASKEATEAKGEEFTDTVTAYVRVGESPIVYEISETAYETLIASSYNDLRHQNVFTADFDDVTQIDITLDGQTYTITSDGEDDPTWLLNEEEVDVTNLSSCTAALTVDEFTDDNASDKEEIHLVYHLDNENFPEITLAFYRYDGTDCLAVLNGSTLGLVSRSSVVNLIEAVNAIVLG